MGIILDDFTLCSQQGFLQLSNSNPISSSLSLGVKCKPICTVADALLNPLEQLVRIS